MLKIIKLFKKLAPKVFRADNNKVVKICSSIADEMIVNLLNKSKNNKL